MDTSFYSSFLLQVWPLVCLILMFAHTIWGIKQIRRAVQDQPLEFDASKVDQCPAGAPKGDIKWVTPLILIAGSSVVLGFLGVPIYIPVFLLFSYGLVHGLSQFGKAGLANRGVISEYVLRLIGIACAFLIPNLLYPGRTILDSKLATGVALLSAGLLATYIGFFLDAKYKPDRLLSRSRMIIGIFFSGIICLFLLNTMWRPITDRRLAQTVESFDRAEFGSASWEVWAIELMQIYGVPRGVDLAALRSYLRPSFLAGLPFIGKSLQNRAMVAYACKARLESIPGIAPLSWLDYVRAEVHLISSILFFALCAYAIFASPPATRVVTNP